ncbi:hypothetical protein CR513_36016, partial [Mucuna pruriens]
MTLGFIYVLQYGLQSSSTCNKVAHFSAASDSLCSKLSVIPKLRPNNDCVIIWVLGLVMGPPMSHKLSLTLLVGSLSTNRGRREECVQAIEGTGSHGLDAIDLYLVPDIVLHPDFKARKFEKYKGSSCPPHDRGRLELVCQPGKWEGEDMERPC